MRWENTKIYKPFKEIISIISTSGSYKQYLPRKTLFKLWLILSYLYIEKPEELEYLSKEITILELDLNSIVERILHEFYHEAASTLELLKHKLVFEDQYGNIEIRNGDYILEEHLAILPVLTRLLSLDTGRFIITKYKKEDNPYAYILLSIPKNHNNTKDTNPKIGANIIKALLFNGKTRIMRKVTKASVAGVNMLEIMAEKEYLDNIIDKLVRILELVGGNVFQKNKQVAINN